MFEHLSEFTEGYRHRRVPIIPMPHRREIKKRPFKPNKYELSCECGVRFYVLSAYLHHYRTEQLIELQEKHNTANQLIKLKALYWRRRAFVLENGTKTQLKALSRIETPEMKPQAHVKALVDELSDVWGPVYRKYAESHDVTVGQVIDETTIEDEAL